MPKARALKLRETKHCEVCGKSVAVYRTQQRFCSVECSNKHHGKERSKKVALAKSLEGAGIGAFSLDVIDPAKLGTALGVEPFKPATGDVVFQLSHADCPRIFIQCTEDGPRLLINELADDHEHLVKIAEMVGEADDIGATWESVAAIICNHNRLHDALKALLENRQGAEVKATATFDDIDRIPEVLL